MRYLKMILIGLLLIVLVYLAEFLVTIPFPMSPIVSDTDRASLLVAEYALTALPALILSFLAALSLKLYTFNSALLHTVVWTLMYVAVIFLLSIADSPDFSTTRMLFTTPTLYLLLTMYFSGPIVFAGTLGHKLSVGKSAKNQ